MLEIKVQDNEKTVYIDFGGYISTKETNNFLAEHKRSTSKISKSKYKLIITPSAFECENAEDVKKICMEVYKSGYKKIYMLDPNNHVVNTVPLSTFERKVLMKVVKFVRSSKDIK